MKFELIDNAIEYCLDPSLTIMSFFAYVWSICCLLRPLFHTKLIVYLIISFVISSAVIPLIESYYLSVEDPDQTLQFFVMYLLCKIFHMWFETEVIEPAQQLINIQIHKFMELKMLNRVLTISHADQKALLDGAEFSRVCNPLKWSMLQLTTGLLSFAIDIIPSVGYIYWISLNYPLISVSIWLSIYLYYVNVTIEVVNNKDYDDIWTVHSIIRQDHYSDLIHNRGEHSHMKRAELMAEFQQLNEKSRLFSSSFNNRLNMIFNGVLIVNLCLINSYDLRTKDLLVLFQYILSIRRCISSLIHLSNEWIRARKDYDTFENVFKDYETYFRTNSDLRVSSELTIKSGSDYVSDNRHIRVESDLLLRRSDVIYVEGESGAGKTTLFDIISGIIPPSKMHFQLESDCGLIKTFEDIISDRTYVSSNISVREHLDNPLRTLTSNDSNPDMDMLHTALSMALCDFIKLDDLEKSRVFSKGQAARLKVAKYLYDVLKSGRTILILDEIADGIDPKKTIQIAQNIFAYIRSNRMICLVATHLPYLQQLDYDGVWHVENGIVRI